MPDTFTETLRAVALNIGVPALIVFWYACRVRHPARPRWQAFLMALAVLATVPAATLAGLHYAITVRDGSPLILIPVGIALPFVLRAIVRAWLRSAPRPRATAPAPAGASPVDPESTGPGVSPGGPQRSGERREGSGCRPCAKSLRSRAVTGPAGPTSARWPHARTSSPFPVACLAAPRRRRGTSARPLGLATPGYQQEMPTFPT